MITRLPKAALLVALPLLAVPAFAEPETGPSEEIAEEEEVEQVETEEVEEKRICKRIAADMSSRRRTKVCKTREEWKAYNDANRGRRH